MLIEGRISKYKARITQEFIRGSKDNDLNDYAIIPRRRSSYCYDDCTGTTATIDRANNSVVKSNAQINNNKNNNNLTIKTRAFVSFIQKKQTANCVKRTFSRIGCRLFWNWRRVYCSTCVDAHHLWP